MRYEYRLHQAQELRSLGCPVVVDAMRRLSTVVLVAVWPGVVIAQARPPQEFQVMPAVSPIVLDGRLRDKFYVGCRAADPDMPALRANLADRDVPRNDDTIGFMIDTFNDGRRAFQFRVNARGVQMDAFNSDVDDSEDWSWDAIWDAKAQIAGSSYTVEVAVPFSSLRFPRMPGTQTWGFMAMRDWPRSSRIRMRSSYVDRNRTCLVCQLDKLSGFTAITPGRNLEFDPTLTVARSDARQTADHAGPLVAGSVEPRAGLSARWSLTPNVVLSGTANPDFYQVEADAAQLNVNDRFQLFFPERRPFFLEGSDFFATPFSAVFTRTIADPDFGLKLTGKEGPHAFGVFAARDSITGILIPGFEGSSFKGIDRSHVASVLRYRRDLGASGSTIGVLYAGRDGDRYSNHVGGVDGLARFSPADSVRVQWIGSRTQYPEALAGESGQRVRPFSGHAFSYRGQTDYNFRQNFGADIRPSGAFSLYANASIGGAVDFANARKADQLRFTFGGSYNLFGRVDGEIDHTTQALDVVGGRLLTARLTQGQVVYHLGLRTFVRAILQFTDITRDPSLYSFPIAPETRRVFSQYLFSYKLNPQTVVLVGYSDNASGTQTVDLTRTDRTLFMKIGYAWVR